MNNFQSIQKIRRAKSDLVLSLMEIHKDKLFGSPPKIDNNTGTLHSATPPNMGLLEKLLRDY